VVADGSITTAKLENSSGSSDGVTTAKLATDAVTTVKITDLNVTTGKIANDAVTLAKMASGTAGNLISYDGSNDPVAVVTGSAGQVLTSNGSGNAPTFQTASSISTGKVFFMGQI